MHDLVGLLELLCVDNPVELLETGTVGEEILRLVERIFESHDVLTGLDGHSRLGHMRGDKRVHRFAEEEFRCAVERETEEEFLDIEARSIRREAGDQVLDVDFQRLNVGDLLTTELGSQHGPGVAPSGSVEGEDAVTQQWKELRVSLTQSKIIELRGQEGFDIFGLAGDVQCPARGETGHRAAIFLVLIGQVEQGGAFAHRVDQFDHSRDAQEARWAFRSGLAFERGGSLALAVRGVERVDDVVDDGEGHGPEAENLDVGNHVGHVSRREFWQLSISDQRMRREGRWRDNI